MKETKPSNMIKTGTLSIATGVACIGAQPIFQDVLDWRIPTFFFAVGGYSLYWYFSTKSKYSVVFQNLGLGTNEYVYPLQKFKKKTDYSTVYGFTLPAGLCSTDFQNKKEAIEQHVGKEIDIRYTYKEIIIEEYNEKMKELIHFVLENCKGMKVPLFIGYDRRNHPIIVDLAFNEPHVLIAGQTGGGKSTLLRSIITTLLLKSNCLLHLVDLKNGTEFRIFEKCKNVKTFCRNIKTTTQLLHDLEIEVNRRYDLFYEKDVKDIVEYNKKFPRAQMGYEILVIDEFADLQGNKECKEILESLGRLARACGIHMILSTQRPDSKVLEGGIKANVTNIIGLKTTNNTNSRIVIDENGLEKLRGNGHGLYKGKKGIIEFQAPLLEPDECLNLIKCLYVDKPKIAAKPQVTATDIQKTIDALEGM